MKPTILISYLLIILSSCKTNDTTPESSKSAELSKLFDDLCVVNKIRYEIPLKLEDLNDVEGVIFEKKGIPYSIFYIKVNKNLYSSCKLSSEFKKDGLKVLFSGISYRLTYICKPGEACPAYEGTPLIISSISVK